MAAGVDSPSSAGMQAPELYRAYASPVQSAVVKNRSRSHVRTFPVIAGTRYSVPGDNAMVEEDGSITLLGRGSGCINSGGEKIFPEEVEGALKAHSEVFDAVVVGMPSERFGQQVACVVQPRGDLVPSLEELDSHCRTLIAGYKVPRSLHVVPEIVRSPSGKPDYRWAKRVLEEALS